MHFTFDAKIYVVAIAPRPLLLDGQPAKAKIDHRNGRIWLSDQLRKHERRRQLFHELRHGWVGAHGRAGDDEADANDAAAMLDELMEQYLAQGGDAVLEAMQPSAEGSTGMQAAASLALREVNCGYCEAPMAVGSIANSESEWSDRLSAFIIERGILCATCDRVTTWREICTEDGMPLGQIVPFPPPMVLTGPASAQWMALHQATARVRVVA